MTTPTNKSEVWNRMDTVPGLQQEILKYQSQLSQREDQLRRALAEKHAAESQLMSAIEDRDAREGELSQAKAELETVKADCAVMRAALEKWSLVPDEQANNQAVDALSTNAGRDLLARYREAVELVKVVGAWCVSEQWNARRDTLLSTVKGEVES